MLRLSICSVLAILVAPLSSLYADDAPAKPAAKLVPLNAKETVLLDKANGRLLLKTKVALTAGVLEMLCCKKNTKEHESIVSIDARAHHVRIGLLAIGAKPGSPVKFDPKFTPPTGTKLDIHATWKDKAGKAHRISTDTWVRHVTRRYFIEKVPDGLAKGMKPLPEDGEMRYDDKHRELIWFGPMSTKERDQLLALGGNDAFEKGVKSIFARSQNRKMETDWVFAGSGTFVDENGDKFFQAESGDVICVANFPSALIDVSAKSSADGEGNLLFEAWTERIPPLGTPVTLEITVAKKAKPTKGAKPE